MLSINACERLKGECWCSFAVRLGGYLAVTVMTAALSADERCVLGLGCCSPKSTCNV